MKQETRDLITELKENNQDFEFYPTSKQMVDVIYSHCERMYPQPRSFLDIGCGTCNFQKYMNESGYKLQYYVMEKSKILLDRLPKETIVLGTDFWQNTLIDKNVDAIFCNPPYSEYEKWVDRIITEASCNYIYLVIPERWKENEVIVEKINQLKCSYTVLGNFDFINAERQARAKVDVVFIDKRDCKTNSAFDFWFNQTFKMRDKKELYEWKKEDNKRSEIKNQLVAGKNKIEILVNLYDNELDTLFNHFSAITSLDVDILESIGVSKKAVMESLQNRMEGLKNLYWKLAFDELDEITSRLTSETKEKLLNSFNKLLSVDFTPENIYSLVIWVCKNASAYYEEQLIELYKKLTQPANVIKYKSNQKVFVNDRWGNRRFDNPDDITHYCLSYRIICDRLYFNSYGYYIETKINQYNAVRIVDDFCAIANNLGFMVGKKEVPEIYGEKYYVYDKSEKTLIEFKVFQNGNTHLKFDKELAKAINVEVSRLLGWIRSKEDIKNEFPDDMAKGAEKYFKTQFTALQSVNNIQLLNYKED